MKYSGFAKIFLFMATLFSAINVGNGKWHIVNPDPDNYSKQVSAKTSDSVVVCYLEKTVDGQTARTKYTSIEKALEVSANATDKQTVVVLPGTNPTITRRCTIGTNVSLILPYDFNQTDWSYSDYTNYKNQSNNGFADKDASAVKTNRKNILTIAEGVTIINNGTIDVAGKIGVGAESNQRPSGFTIGSYCEILMKASSKIQNSGSINLYGYIKESSKDNGSSIVNSSTGSVKMPFTIYDFRGGTYSDKAYPKYSMPFSYFDFPNCHVEQVFNLGSKLIGFALLYALSSYNSGEILVLGKESEDCLFKMCNGNATLKYVPSNFGYSTSDVSNNTTGNTANYTKITIDGDLKLSSIVVRIPGYTFNSSSIECPISYKFQITQNTGTLTIANKMKFLTGSSLTIGKKATCIMNAPITFYQSYSPILTIGSNNVSPQYTKMGRAKLVVDGALTINSSFGGVINTTDSDNGGTVTTGSEFVDFYVSKERIDNNDNGWNVHSESAETYKIESETAFSTFRLEKEKTYSLCSNYWSDNSFTDLTSLTIDNPSGSSSDEKTYTVNAIFNCPSYDSNVNLEWQLFESTNKSNISTKSSITLKTNGYSVSFTAPASSSGSVYYKLKCSLSFTRKNGETASMSLESGEYEAYYSSGGCLLPTARVLMADGTYKQAGEIKTGDMVISFNHGTGQFEPNRVIGNDHSDSGVEMRNIVHLEFSNGNSTDYIYRHAYFDKTLNKYVNLYEDNFDEYIGHEFVCYDKGRVSTTTLVSASIKKMFTALAAPATANHLNLVTDDMLSIEAGLNGLYNIFEYDPNTLAFDKEKMDADIQEYGLLGYESFEKYFPKEIYDLLPCKYLGVSIGKGLITWDIFEDYYNRWKDLLMGNL